MDGRMRLVIVGTAHVTHHPATPLCLKTHFLCRFALTSVELKVVCYMPNTSVFTELLYLLNFCCM